MNVLRKYKKIIAVLLVVLVVCSFCYSCFLGVVLSLFGLTCIALLVLVLLLNKLIKKSNWYKNIFIHTNQFVTNAGYRNDLQRNYEIVNLGSNPALYSFFYEHIKGQNWATGSQGPEMDLEILKYYYSYLKKGGIVLIPIVAFSSCTPYLWHKKNRYLGMQYYSRFAKVLENNYQASKCIPNLDKVKMWIKYPLICQPNVFLHLFRNTPIDNRLCITEQTMSCLELNNDADKWIEGWKHEFNIKNLDLPLDNDMEAYHEECANKFVEIINFCKERDLKPVLIFPPMSNVLNARFSEKAKDTYIYSFIRNIQKKTAVDFLDYMCDKRFSSTELFFNSFFLNLRGRKLFTKQVLKDLNL